MYDIARGMRGDAAYLEKLIRRLAHYGYNMLVLNLEYRFKFPGHPEIGTRDSLSPEDVKKLDSAAREVGMDLVPFFNCGGHNEGIGLLEKYKHLSVDPTGMMGTTQIYSRVLPLFGRPSGFSVEQILIGDAEASQLMEDLYDGLMSCFSSRYIHIGFDEVRQMHIQMPDATEEERWEKVMSYLLHIINYVKSKGKIPMLWGDMFLRHSERAKDLQRLPKDAVICDWSYDDNPDSYQAHLNTQACFYNAGMRAVACPAVNGFVGTPILSEISSGNIKKFNKAHESVFGKDGTGVLLCSWETNFGGCFSAHWPWIYLQSKLFKNEATDGLDFLREYTRVEWGLDTDELKLWYETIDIELKEFILEHIRKDKCKLKILEDEGLSVSLLVWKFRKSIFRSDNILKSLQDMRIWLDSGAVAEIVKILEKGLILAESMYHNSITHKEESLRLVQWNNAFISMFKLIGLTENLSQCYHEAALNQGENFEVFKERILNCAAIMSLMLKETEALKEWSEIVVLYENHADEERWWINRAREDLKKRMAELISCVHNGRSLINFNRFVRIEADIPNRVFNR